MKNKAAILTFDTPEGVPLSFQIGSLGRRVFAFAVDSAIILVSLIVFATLVILVFGDESGWANAFLLIASFLVRNFYFVIAEISGRGQTIGKKMARLRVADIHGRPLTGNAIFLRNVTRDAETFLPLIAIAAPQTLMPGAPWWIGLLALVWLVALAALPLLTKNRRRVGDMIAGTVVVHDPHAELLDDLVETTRERTWYFTDQQLDMYGVYELQVLEGILREGVRLATLEEIAEKIGAKIGLDSGRWRENPRDFLQEFYLAMRRRHEHRMLLGDRQESKRQGRIKKR